MKRALSTTVPLHLFGVAVLVLGACASPLPEPVRGAEAVAAHRIAGLPVTIEFVESDASYVPLIELRTTPLNPP